MYGKLYLPLSLAGLLGAPDAVLVFDLYPVETGEAVIGRTDDGTEVTLNRFYVLGVAILIPQNETGVMHDQLTVTIDGVERRCTPCISGGHYHIRDAVEGTIA